MRNVHHALRRNILHSIDFFYTPFNKIMPLQTFRYAACGGVNTAFDIGLFTLSYHFIFNKRNLALGPLTLSPHIASLFFAFCFSLPSGFYLNRYIVFQHSGLKRHTQLVRYIIVVLICVVFNYLFLKLFVDYFGWYATPSKILTTVLITIFSYTSQTYFFFKLKPHNKA
ncbi:GtrA family protein [Mucilaginibacter gotjawali]|uniref:Flippase GtrA n=2 Tax=Mucilaginibacter gotjawali TaxID=1550579 RepID=A0A839SNB5_9SPHI|nr:GtrA family protein [Mucilaginibacter gotjawali]MBB3057887.1 putative flippase GtrA [Mucilaginibacter gotjawali]BAU52341.1 GtrA-like protein [Mucilaginibacter gotjawali]